MLKLNVSKTLGDFRLDAAFTADLGVTAVFGPSGSGKTSVAHMLAGLLTPEQGRIEVAGRVLFDRDAGIDLPPEDRGLGYVFQDGRLFPHLTVGRNLLFGQRRKNRPLFDEVVGLLGLDSLLARHPKNLSGGEKQRVAIGRALLADPKILIMDEPLSALDESRKVEVLPYLVKLVHQARLPILYISHSMDEVIALAHTLVLMDKGRVAATGSVEELLARPDLRPLTGRVDAGAVISATILSHDPINASTCLDFPGGRLTVGLTRLATGERVRLRIHAKDVAIALDKPLRTSVRNVIECSVTGIYPTQSNLVDVTLDAQGSTLWAQVSRQSATELDLKPGMAVWAMVKAVTLGRDMIGAVE